MKNALTLSILFLATAAQADTLREEVPLMPVTDLRIESVAGGVHLTWSPPTTDVNGDTPLIIEGYKIYSLDPQTHDVIESLASVSTEEALMLANFFAKNAVCFAVTALGLEPHIHLPTQVF
jgi:hypothetical protein